MSEEAVDMVSEDTAQETTQESTQDNNRDNGKPAGYHPVDPETASPEEVKNRIDYLYRQVKDQGRHLNDYRSVTQQQSQKIEELMNGVGQVVNHLHSKSYEENLQDARQKMQTAFEAGDTKAYLAEQERLQDLKRTAPQPQQRQQQNQTRQQAYAGMGQISNEAAQNGEISQEDNRLVAAWQDETDERGNPVRPWTKTSDPSDPDPDFVKALIVAKKVWAQNPHKSAKENLAEVDRQMGIKQNGGGQNVMGGSLNTRAKGSKLVLSPQQERIAVKTKFGAKGGAKSDADYIAAYRKQIESVQSKTKGSR